MESMGPVRLRDVDEAQSEIIIQAKDLINSGEMNLAQGEGDEDELVY